MYKRHLQFASYGAGSIGNGIYNTVPGLLLMFYMTNQLGIPVALATIAVFAPKAIDVITDPLLGSLSDATRTRWGRRRPYLLVGLCTLPPLFALMFATPAFVAPMQAFWFVTLTYILCTLAYTVYAVPYVAMSTEIPEGYHERTTVNGYRMGFVMIGILASGALAPAIVELGGGGREGYRLMSLVLAALIFLSWLPALLTTGHVRQPTGRPTAGLVQMLRGIARNGPFLRLLLTYVLQLTAMSCLTATLAYYVTYILEEGLALIAAVFVVMNVTGVLVMPLWVLLARRAGKLNGLICASCALIAAYASLVLFDADTPRLLFMAVVCLSGVGTGGQQLFAFSMLADTIVHGQARAGEAGEALYSGFFTASEKIGMAAGALVAGTLFALTGLVETTAGSVAQPASALTGIRLAFSLVPAAIILASLGILAGYRRFERDQLGQLAAPAIPLGQRDLKRAERDVQL